MKKHKLTVCCGTACYLSAGDRFDELERIVNEKFFEKINIVPTACLGQCKKVDSTARPPFVKLDDNIIADATTDKIISELEKLS